MPKLLSPPISNPMLRANTPVEDHTLEYGLWVKREDLACPSPGPPFSKARGVYAHMLKRPEKVFGVLDTAHSQAGWAVARAAQVLGRKCINYYPAFKANPGPHKSQLQAKSLGAELVPLPAGRSAILFHQAKKLCLAEGGYMFPNALKLEESIQETAKEVPATSFDYVIIPISSGTIAAGVIKGFAAKRIFPTFLIHMGYTRSYDEVEKYLREKSGIAPAKLELIDEGYAYKDQARPGESPPWPCNQYYDLKAFRWWLKNKGLYLGSRVLMWNVG